MNDKAASAPSARAVAWQVWTLTLAAALTSCVPLTGLSHREPPADWPLLRVSWWMERPAEVISKCYPAVPMLYKVLGSTALACASIDFDKLTCDIIVQAGDYDSLHHEIDHCYGRLDAAPGTLDLTQVWQDHLAHTMAKTDRYIYVRAKDKAIVQLTKLPGGEIERVVIGGNKEETTNP